MFKTPSIVRSGVDLSRLTPGADRTQRSENTRSSLTRESLEVVPIASGSKEIFNKVKIRGFAEEKKWMIKKC